MIPMIFNSPKTKMDTQNDGLEKVDSLKIWPFLVSIRWISGVYTLNRWKKTCRGDA